MAIAKGIPDEPSQNVVLDAFDVLSGQKPFTSLTSYLPTDLMRLTASDIDTSNWKSAQTCDEWWKRPQVLRKLCSRKDGYVVSFDGYSPEKNETIKSLRKTIEKNEIKLL